MLAPLLLLLSQDPLILPMLGEQQRYFPSGLALVTYLTLTAIMQASPIRICPQSLDPSSGESWLNFPMISWYAFVCFHVVILPSCSHINCCGLWSRSCWTSQSRLLPVVTGE